MLHMGGIYKRGNIWYYRTRRNGQLFRESLAKYGISTEAGAKAYLREVERLGLENRLAELDPSTMKLSYFIEQYLEHRKNLNLSPHTKKQDKKAFASLIRSLGINFLLRNLRQKHIEQWAGELLKAGISPNSINSYLTHIKAGMTTAVEWGYIKNAPRLKKIKAPNRLPRALLPEEISALLEAEENAERRALWLFFLWTGLRCQEALSLTWADVHLGETPWIKVTGKGNKERIVPLMPEAVQSLAVMPKADIGPVWIFARQHYKGCISPIGTTVSHWFKSTAIKAAGKFPKLAKAKLHDLRHTAATWMVWRQVDPQAIQAVMGHSNFATTQIYTKGYGSLEYLYNAMKPGISKVSQ
jgi:integrase